MILILSSPDDAHAQAVTRELAALGERPELLDLSQYPQQAQLSWRYEGSSRRYELTARAERFDLAACSVIWWRRPQPFRPHPQLSNEEYRRFAYSEMHEAFSGMWSSLDAFWINDPTMDDRAHRKVYQLRTAQAVGLSIPQTLITSDPAEAHRFVDRVGLGQTIYKAFTATPTLWRETRLLTPEELHLVDNVRYAPVIFQRYVPAEYDLRITVVAETIFAAAVHSQQTAYKVDMRMDIANASITPVELPARVEGDLKALMKALGLVYGAIDMRLTPQGDYVFLEINPAGQWLFVEERTAQPIAEAMARLMAERARAPGAPP